MKVLSRNGKAAQFQNWLNKNGVPLTHSGPLAHLGGAVFSRPSKRRKNSLSL